MMFLALENGFMGYVLIPANSVFDPYLRFVYYQTYFGIWDLNIESIQLDECKGSSGGFWFGLVVVPDVF